MLKIVDVSSYQSNYIPGTEKENGIIVKATEGVDYINPTCDKQIQQAIKKDMLFGVYHFASADATAANQAKFFYNNIKGYLNTNKCVVVLDYEQAAESADEFIVQFYNAFKKLSDIKTLIIYGSTSVISGARKTRNPLWLAYYPYASSALSPATWKAPNFPLMIEYPITMWQFTTSNDKLDRSIFYGDGKAWRKLSVKP